ncbi:hypothetical protein [Streptomyces chilikensis]|uniref:Uncharacterized protein n=1 Tax=Streptomyces chilikensis TaxID=1194079 RepID=A0ABV3ERD3_9ACTN
MTTSTLPPRLRTTAAPARTIRPALPPVPWRHHELFTEPRYTDGQPYHDDTDDEDDNE